MVKHTMENKISGKEYRKHVVGRCGREILFNTPSHFLSLIPNAMLRLCCKMAMSPGSRITDIWI